MQTFITDLPANGYGFQYLDSKRVVKQLLETRQIMSALAGKTKGWRNHPATLMWRGKELMLLDYARCNAAEMETRDYQWWKNLEWITELYEYIEDRRETTDEWDSAVYYRVLYTHRGRLWEKNPNYYAEWALYSDFRNYVCCERCDYFWPTH